MSSCAILTTWKSRILCGEDPDDVIPYHIDCTDPDDLEEIYFYCIQVLPEGRRKEACRRNLIELLEAKGYAGRR